MVDRVHIGVGSICPIEHYITMPQEFDGAVPILFQLGMGAEFQAAGDFGQLIPCLYGILPDIAGGLLIQQGILDVVDIVVQL